MKKRRLHNQYRTENRCCCKAERLQKLSELRASLYEAICTVDEEIETLLRNDDPESLLVHRDNTQKEKESRIHQESSPGCIVGGNTMRILGDVTVQDYSRFARNEL